MKFATMPVNNPTYLQKIDNYYTEKINQHGPVPAGADWNSLESQHIRFDQLLKVIPERSHFSVLDFGCGYGAMFAYMKERFESFSYAGFDISEAMITQARATQGDEEATWCVSLEQAELSIDYVIASGIFNVKLDYRNEEWLAYILETLTCMNQLAGKAFAFNVLTQYSDKPYRKSYLYYADPQFLFRNCKEHFSRMVALLHDYPLYEFTIYVRK